MPRLGDDAVVRQALRQWRAKAHSLGRMLWRYGLLMLVCLLGGFALTAAYLSGRTPAYQAVALVAISEGSSQQAGQEAPMQDGDPEVHLRLIQSRAMAERLVDRLDLQLVPEFHPDQSFRLTDLLEPGRWLPHALLERLPRAWAARLMIEPRDGEMTDEERAARLREQVIEATMASARAEVARRTVLGLHFISEDPQLAAAGANALAELYLEEHSALRRNALQGAREALAEEIERLRASISDTEQAIEAARASAEAQSAQPTEQTLLDLTGELAFWRRERAGVEAHLRQVQAALQSGAALNGAALGADSERLGQLRAREAELQQILAGLSEQYGEEDPQIVELRTALAALQEEKRSEIELIITRLRDEIEIIQSRETVLEAEIAKIEALEGQATETDAPGRLEVLEQRLQAERAQLQNQIERLEQLEAQSSEPLPDARIIAPATVPDQPIHPRQAVIWGVAAAGALLSGVLLASVMEAIRRARA